MSYEGWRKEKRTLAVRILFSVPGPGIEPGWVAPPVFETGASTDSAIRANGSAKVSVFFVFHNTKIAETSSRSIYYNVLSP